MQWLDGLSELRARAESGVLVTLLSVRGHAPREAGAKMLVAAEQTWDTVGGGNLEAAAIARARQMLHLPEALPETLTLPLNPRAPQQHARQCCGGEVVLLLEVMALARPTVAIFGAGHVGLALARMMQALPWAVHLIDSRQALLSGLQDQGIYFHHAPLPERVLPQLPPQSYLVILTHDHAEDLTLCDAALRHEHSGAPPWAFIGLIGSAAKWAHFRTRLAAEGHSAQVIARITTPIGIGGISGKVPAVIALSVAAQLQALLENATNKS